MPRKKVKEPVRESPPACNGKRCPTCDTVYDFGSNGHWGKAWHYDAEPHQDKDECIRQLSLKIERLENSLIDIESRLDKHNF